MLIFVFHFYLLNLIIYLFNVINKIYISNR